MSDKISENMYVDIINNCDIPKDNNLQYQTDINETLAENSFDDDAVCHVDTPMVSRLNIGEYKGPPVYCYSRAVDNDQIDDSTQSVDNSVNGQCNVVHSNISRNNVTIMEEKDPPDVNCDEFSDSSGQSNSPTEDNDCSSQSNSSRDCSPEQDTSNTELNMTQTNDDINQDDKETVFTPTNILHPADQLKVNNDIVKILGLIQNEDIPSKVYHQPPKSVDRDAAKRLARRLFECDGFKITDVAKHLSKKNDFSQIVGEEFSNYFEFCDMRLDKALRLFLSKFTLTGEVQERERIMHHFSRRYVACNKGVYNGEDACHTLVCALIILNTNLHTQVIPKMTCSDFINNLAQFNDGENFSSDNLQELFEAIEQEPIRWPIDDELVNIVGISKPDMAEVSKQYIASQNFAYPFDINPQDSNSREFMRGHIVRKWLKEPGGRKTSFGKRGWRLFYARLRDLTIYLYKHSKMYLFTDESPTSIAKRGGSLKNINKASVRKTNSTVERKKSKKKSEVESKNDDKNCRKQEQDQCDPVNNDEGDVSMSNINKSDDKQEESNERKKAEDETSGNQQNDDNCNSTETENLSSSAENQQDSSTYNSKISATESVISTEDANFSIECGQSQLQRQQQQQQQQQNFLSPPWARAPAPIKTQNLVMPPSSCEIHINHAIATRATDYVKKKYVLRIRTKYGSEYLFEVNNEKELENWIDNINYAAALLSDPEPIIGMSTMERMNAKSIPRPKITNLNMRDQLDSHQKCVLELEKAILNLNENPPKKPDRKMKHEFDETIRFRTQELQRYKTYSQLLESDLMKMVLGRQPPSQMINGTAAGGRFIAGDPAYGGGFIYHQAGGVITMTPPYIISAGGGGMVGGPPLPPPQHPMLMPMNGGGVSAANHNFQEYNNIAAISGAPGNISANHSRIIRVGAGGQYFLTPSVGGNKKMLRYCHRNFTSPMHIQQQQQQQQHFISVANSNNSNNSNSNSCVSVVMSGSSTENVPEQQQHTEQSPVNCNNPSSNVDSTEIFNSSNNGCSSSNGTNGTGSAHFVATATVAAASTTPTCSSTTFYEIV